MAKFRKRIMGPDTYTVRGEQVSVPEKRMRKWVTSFNRMKKAGYKIPAPFRHEDAAEPIRTPDDKDIDSFNNGGWWEKVWVSGKDKSLWGLIDVPDEEKAEKLRKGEITEVSPAVKSTFETGNGDQYDEAMTHIALVTHPIAPKQESFEEEETLAAAMCFSRFDAEGYEGEDDGWEFQAIGVIQETPQENINATDASLQDVIKVLRRLGLTLPADTDESNFTERVVTAALAISGEYGDVRQEPVPPISLSQDKDMTDSTDDKAKDTTTTESPPPVAQLTPEQAAGLQFAQRMATKSYVDRIEDLVNRGRITAKVANEKLGPMIKNMKLEFSAEGNPVAGELDRIIDILETVPQQTSYDTPGVTISKSGDHMFSMATDIVEQQSLDQADNELWPDNEPDDPNFDPDKFIDDNPALSRRVEK